MAQGAEEDIALQTREAVATIEARVVPVDQILVADDVVSNDDNMVFPSGSKLWFTMGPVFVACFLNGLVSWSFILRMSCCF